MKLEGWIIYTKEGNFYANRHRSIVETELDFLDLSGKLQWEGEPCKLSQCTITIPPSEESNKETPHEKRERQLDEYDPIEDHERSIRKDIPGADKGDKT